MNKLHTKLTEKFGWYARWHNRKEHRFWHFFIFFCTALLVAFGANTYLSVTAQTDAVLSVITASLPQRQNDLRGITTQLLTVSKQYLLTAPAKRNQLASGLINIAQTRRNKLLSAIGTDPQEALLVALSQDVNRQLPIEIQAFLERKIEVKGTLTVLNSDALDPVSGQYTRSELIYQVESDGTLDNQRGKRYTLHFAKERPELLTGSEVITRGIALDNEMVLAQGGGTSLETVTAATSGPTGVQNTLVMLFNFQNNNSQPWTPSSVYATVFTNPDSSDFYYQDNSFGLTSFAGDLYGWFTIPYDSSTGCNYTTWASAAKSAATAAGYNLANYNRLVYVFPYASPCSAWAGLGTLGGNPSEMWNNGYGNNSLLYDHELGHNLGVHHASTLSCGTKQVDVSSACTASEYGDSYTTMGSWNSFQFNGPHKNAVTWVPSSQVQAVTVDGTYTITPTEINNTATKLLKINKPSTTGRSGLYYFSYRQPFGFDSYLPSGITRGASVHIWSGSTAVQTFFLDSTPGNGFSDAALADGALFEDTINGITVTQLNHSTGSAGSVSLAVHFGPAVCLKVAPTVTIAPFSQTAAAGQTLNYTISVKNNDSSVCSNTNFVLNSILPTGWNASITPTSLSLVPGGSGTATWTVTSRSGEVDGSYGITASAVDAADAAHAASASATYVVFTDTIPPSVVITNPANGAKIKVNVKINVSASDNDRVNKVEFYIDGVLRATDTTVPYTYNWNTRSEAAGSHTIMVRAYDPSGNFGVASVSVSK